MANKKAKQDNKNVIIGICCAVVVIVVVIVAIVMATRGSQLNDKYFVSDNTKYVLTFETDASETDGSDIPAPVKMHVVYTYSGDDITGAKSYYEFADADSAQKYYDAYLKEGTDNTFKSVTVDGKYVILEANEDDYKDMKASDVKAQVEMLEAMKNGDYQTDDDTTQIEDVETVEAGEATETTVDE